jgi:hypothetical protein
MEQARRSSEPNVSNSFVVNLHPRDAPEFRGFRISDQEIAVLAVRNVSRPSIATSLSWYLSPTGLRDGGGLFHFRYRRIPDGKQAGIEAALPDSDTSLQR